MAPESQQYMAFTVGNLEFYKFTPMPFGLCNVPMTFQYLMQNTFGGAEPHILHDLPGRRHSLWPHGGGALGAPLHCVQEVPGVQFEA